MPNTIYLKDYAPYPFHIESIDLRFELEELRTRVTARSRWQRRAAGPLRLDGQELQLNAVRLDGKPLTAGDYQVDADTLVIAQVPDAFTLEIETIINPAGNTALEGLYVSGGNFCTQCEAEGFRKITYFPDRPDVMTVYTTTLIAEQSKFPVLLANGNLVAEGERDDGRHYATWHDPFPKPCYLFALVAGDLDCVTDSYTTRSGRTVALRLYVRSHDLDKTSHAMASLKHAMAWDEETYGREYDLDIYMIVAVSDFNMGAMENKGLNIFNSRYVLASQDTATDADYVAIEGVIGHEYFHNWSGNRVTCRDWFQLSLKEGFTVLRDQQFTAAMTGSAVPRIDDVRLLRSHQFQEDAGPLAHPVRPASYQEINNFYTLTVYEKGAEVVRMLHTLLGPELFRQGTDLYFSRHDGQAVTTDDFVQAMMDVSGRDLAQFKRWYDQAGTPRIAVERRYDAAQQSYTLTLRQSCPPSPGQEHKLPFHIPLRTALLDGSGAPLPLRLVGETAATGTERVLELTEEVQSFTFSGVAAEPVPSLLRGFSAPVKLALELDDGELAFLMGHDNDSFNRWEAGQQLALRVLLRLIDVLHSDGRPALDGNFSAAFARTLADGTLDPALVAEALTLPAEEYVAESMTVVDPQAIHVARQYLRRNLGFTHREALLDTWQRLTDEGPYHIDAAAMGRRRLRNLCLGYLVEMGNDEVRSLAMSQLRAGANMTDVMAALTALVHSGAPERSEALAAFYARWRDDALVLDKWFAIQATAPVPGTLDQVKRLAASPDFNLKNPNRVRSLVGAFCARNPVRFHEADGSGYAFLADYVCELNALNPQIASRLLTPLTQWRRYDTARQALMRAQLERIGALPALSRDLAEVVGKSLK
ncbi:MAG: aminopeptidase N [Gammaproteobacteria bacterium HGW-Gammaproteobacteria-1]|jgi:aminopeptidase N|nr:MAG: aminopeptidase N [Gammaproteobacteria bacterium HGW-Gammaproteobacteria-1]